MTSTVRSARPPRAPWLRALLDELSDLLTPPWERGLLSPRAALAVGGAALLLAFLIATQPLRYVAGGLAAGVFFVLALVRPEVGLGLILFSIPFGALAEVVVGGIALTVTQPLIALVVLAWVLRVAAARRADFRWSPMIIPFVIYLLLFAQSVALAEGLLLAVKEYAKFVEAFLLLIVTVNVVRTQRQVIFLVSCLIAAGALAATQGWYQFFLRRGPEGFLVAERFIRAHGEFGQPNPYAGFLNLGLPIIFAILLVAVTQQRERAAAAGRGGTIVLGLPLLFAAGAGVLMTGAEAMSFSRAGWLALAAAVVAILATRSRRTFLLLLGGVTAGLVIWLFGALDLLPPVVLERLRPIADTFSVFDISEVELTAENWSVVERMATWQAAADMFATNIWYGIGPGNFQRLWPEFGALEWVLRGTNPPHAHNYYLNALAESGIVGLTAYLLLIVSAFAYTTVRIRGAQRRGAWAGHPYAHPLALALGMLGVLIAISVHHLFDSVFVRGMTAQVGLMLGLVEAGWQVSSGTQGEGA
ncbi:MAG: O-antigen ligase family protein [Chloroflexota bacterium]|nr:O-antigen ligase family protein [Dehalococcoidia bacterium]MDW8253204.1 O-antigen ligase family protein [Chloroflexota bacterium]